MVNKIAVVLLACFFLASSSFASQYFEYKAGETVKAGISSKGLNRIEFGRSAISEVIGDESKYSLVTSKEGTNVFITPKVASGTIFNITLISASGLVQDLELKSTNIGAQSIIINMPKAHKKALENEEITKLLKTMQQDVKGKYYVQKHNALLELPFSLEDFSGKRTLIKQKTYHFKDLTGVILDFKNNSKLDAVIKAEDFKGVFANTLLIAPSTKLVAAKGKAKVFIIVKEAGDDR